MGATPRKEGTQRKIRVEDKDRRAREGQRWREKEKD